MNFPKLTFKITPRDKKILKNIAIVILVLTVIAFWTEQVSLFILDDENEDYYEEDYGAQESCNVSGIGLHGSLVTYISNENLDEEGYPITDETSSEYIMSAIEQAEDDNSIKAIIIEIDSYGGYMVADEEVANALKRAAKPTVALIRSAAVSAAYYAATGADTIFASKDSDVGSIGVTMSYLDYTKQNQKEGITFNQISSGKFKNIMDPDKPLTNEERQLLERDLKILYENFVQAVAENRKMDIEKVRQLADGSSMLGQMALENGLIDRIGGIYEVKEYLKELIGAEVEVCW